MTPLYRAIVEVRTYSEGVLVQKQAHIRTVYSNNTHRFVVHKGKRVQLFGGTRTTGYWASIYN